MYLWIASIKLKAIGIMFTIVIICRIRVDIDKLFLR